jgi:uncharacterized protein YbjT (DUF2867 family)
MNPTVADALAGARYQAPVALSHKSVLVIGAAGRLGERVLTRLLGDSRYQRIYVLAVNKMPTTEPKLFPMLGSEWHSQIDDVIAIVDDGTQPHMASTRKRTEIFSSVAIDAVLSLAQQAKALGTKRFMLVTPTEILLRPAAIYAQLANLMEVELHQLGFESLLLVRPSDHEVRQRQSGLAARFWGALVNTATGLMMGPKFTPLSLDSTARAIALVLNDDTPGLQIVETERMQQLLQQR